LETWERFVSGVSCWVEEMKLRVPFDVIEIADFGAEGLLLGLGRRRPLVAHLHGPLRLTQRYSEVERRRDVRLADWLERTTVARADLITSPSDLVSRELSEARWLQGRAARTVRNPVDLEQWADVAPVGTGRPLVLTVGRVEHLKGPEVLVRAAVRLAEEAGDVEVVFVGRSSGEREGLQYREWIARLASQLGAPCRFMDQVPRRDLRGWYETARVVAVPSLYESLSMSGLEALASGRPVVCSTSTGVAELVANSGTGAVVPPGSPDLLAEALLPYVLDPETARRAGRRGRKLIQENCSPEFIAEQRERCYREVVSG
jgi:glycosyltransferase involved in cell wall biosynthesis